MARPSAHKWEFKARSRFRRHAFGWRSQPAIQRVKQATSEIRKFTRTDPVLAAEGAVTLFERLSPAIEHVDGSSGAIGTAVDNAIAERIDTIWPCKRSAVKALAIWKAEAIRRSSRA